MHAVKWSEVLRWRMLFSCSILSLLRGRRGSSLSWAHTRPGSTPGWSGCTWLWMPSSYYQILIKDLLCFQLSKLFFGQNTWQLCGVKQIFLVYFENWDNKVKRGRKIIETKTEQENFLYFLEKRNKSRTVSLKKANGRRVWKRHLTCVGRPSLSGESPNQTVPRGPPCPWSDAGRGASYAGRG